MTTTHARAELAVPAGLAAIGLAALIGGVGYGVTDDDGRVGTGFLPVVCGGALAVLAVADGVATRRRQTAAVPAARRGKDPDDMADDAADDVADADADDRDIRGRTAAQRMRAFVAVAVLVVVAVALVPVVGFLLSFAALLLVVTVVVEKMGVLSSILVTVAAVALIWGVFVQFLSVPLPQGLLGLI